MASYVTPKKNTEYIFYIGLPDQSDTKLFKSTPTIAAGDFKVSIDGGALNNPATLPTNTPASSKMVKVTLSASEMNGDNITFIASDAAGAEWCDVIMNIQTSARQIDDLATSVAQTTAQNDLDIITGSDGTTLATSQSNVTLATPTTIWDHILENSLTAEGLMRIIAAGVAGKASGLEDNQPVYLGVDGSQARITAETDKNGNRLVVTLNVAD